MSAAKDVPAQLTARERLLVKALRPFAEAAKQFERGPGGHLATDRIAYGLTVGDLFSASEAITKANGSKP